MFTSRAEYRLLLREDNADLRLSPKAIELGMLSTQSADLFHLKLEQIEKLTSDIQSFYLLPKVETREKVAALGISDLHDRTSAEVFLRRPEVDFSKLAMLGFQTEVTDSDVLEQIEIRVKYKGYIEKDMALLEGVRNADSMRIPLSLDYREIQGLSNEIRGRLSEVRPESIGQASRIQGVTPAAIANLMIFIKSEKHLKVRPTL